MSFDELQLFLAQWPRHSMASQGGADALMKRLADIFANGKCLPEEWLPMLRQALARETARQGSPAMLRLPQAPGWPTPSELEAHKLHIVQQDAQSALIQAKPWYPDWLGTGEGDLFADAFAELPCPRQAQREMDPLLHEASGFDRYMSPGQRAAVHAVLMAPEGSTLVVTLPTGSGKSLIAQAPPLLAGEGACTIVVVPTVALAMDQARQFNALWLRRYPGWSQLQFAWHSDTPAEQKQQIKQNLRQGRQPILFTSPESVVGSLRLAIQDAALRGYLRYLVVDEAHLVAQWGDSFRPEFQSLAAFRRTLATVAKRPFKTVLMTATLAADVLATIESLFTHDRPAELVASVHLRTEPRYWFARAASEQDQVAKVLALLAHAPRPLMLYVTEVKRARQWEKLLRERHWRRFGVFHGKTPSTERRRLIDAWANGELDVMVATSAFGVGIDKRDVRCVIHACVPESLDRYYQEVGRGGRDGKAACAVAVYTDQDARTAESIAAPSLITSELGLPRWLAMLNQGARVHELPGTVMRLDLATVAPNLNQESDYNRAWNLRTLMLMARSGVIELTTEPPSASDAANGEPPAELSDDEVRHLFDTVLVRILDPHHGEEWFWSETIEASRAHTFAAALEGVKRMRDVFAGHCEIGRALQELYTLRQEGRRVLVDASCSGCPVCRNSGEANGLHAMSAPVRVITLPEAQALDLWRQHLPAQAQTPAYILFNEQDPQLFPRLQRLALLLARCGLRELRASGSDWPDLCAWHVLRLGSHAPFVALTRLDDPEEELVQVPRLSLLRHPDTGLLARLVPHMYRPFDWVVVPDTIADPFRPDRRLADAQPAVPLLTAIETLDPWVS